MRQYVACFERFQATKRHSLEFAKERLTIETSLNIIKCPPHPPVCSIAAITASSIEFISKSFQTTTAHLTKGTDNLTMSGDACMFWQTGRADNLWRPNVGLEDVNITMMNLKTST